MNILKRLDSFVEFIDSDGYVIKTLSENVTMNYYEGTKAINIVDLSGRFFDVKLNKVRTTQIEGNEPVIFEGDLSELWDLLISSFFIEKHANNSVFGTVQYYEEEETETTNDTTTFIDKVTLTALNLPLGRYQITAISEFRVSRTNRSGYVQLIRNVGSDNDVINQTDQEVKDTTNYNQFYALKEMTLSGDQRFSIRFRSEQNGTTTRIRRARIKLLRVS